MKYLADESVDFPIIKQLRNSGFEVASIAELSPGISDESVFSKSVQGNLILITSDKDFGEIVFRLKRVNAGIVLLRINGLQNTEKAEMVGQIFINHSNKFMNKFVVIERDNLRIRSLDFYK